MALSTRLALLAAILFSAPAWAQTSSSTLAGTATTATTTPALLPPRPLTPPVIAYPSDAPPIDQPVSVTVKLRVDEAGDVVRVELLLSGGPAFDHAVLVGATSFRFEPATYLGVRVAVDIHFTQRFEPPPAIPEVATATGAGARKGRLTGRLEERGTRAPVAFATVIVSSSEGRVTGFCDATGVFSLEVPPDALMVEVQAAGFLPFLQREEVSAGGSLEVHYLLERATRDPLKVVVRAPRDREEIAAINLRGREIHQMPGTFGDPFRVISALPGVAPVMSLLPYPVVRGSSPGNTGFLIDGVRVPLLFHLLAGPSVIHPELIDEIEFHPGSFPVNYGGYTGGIVNGRSRAGELDDESYDVDLNFFQLGGLARRGFESLGVTGTLAGRLGFPGLLISLASPRVSLSYWDYQARVDGGSSDSGFTVFVFGAKDALDSIPDGQPDTAELEPLLRLQFHRLDLRYHHQTGGLRSQFQLVLGYDDSLSKEDASLESFSVTPRLAWTLALERSLSLGFGLDGMIKSADLTVPFGGIGGALGDLVGGISGLPAGTLYSLGLFVEAQLRPFDGLLIRPGVRADLYNDTSATQIGVDPRLLARYQLTPEVWLKGGVGLYHQPPRFTVPIPGLDELAFEQGLLQAVQTSLGTEVNLAAGWSFDAQVYYNWMDPILYDIAINPSVDQVEQAAPEAPPGVAPPLPPRDTRDLDDRLDELLVKATGRAYGVEVMLRRQSPTGVSGWISYTLSRSERLRDDGWQAFDFDRTHLLNFVLSLSLPRRWQLGLRAQLQSGRPLTTTSGRSSARTDVFVRFDLRVDKTAVWNDWLLDFYADVSNAMLGGEELSPEVEIRYVLPTLGFRAIF